MNPSQLPPGAGLDIQSMSRLFDDTTNSYKLLFFRSILDLILDRRVGEDRLIPFTSIAVKMISSAWKISEYYNLSLGPRDRLALVISELKIGYPKISLTSNEFDNRLEVAIKEHEYNGLLGDLPRYVPYRLLRPFFSSQLRGIADYKVNAAINMLARSCFHSNSPPLYEIIGDNEIFIHMNERWFQYFLLHLKVLVDWCDWHLAKYLQSRNPSAPSITKKLRLPKSRSSLSRYQKMWLPLIEREGLSCIYSGEPIMINRINLDHYLPWSFVCHDEPWNLIPVSGSANSAKGNSIPDSKYLPSFVEQHSRALRASKHTLSEKDWENISLSYLTGLRLTDSDLLDEEALFLAYKETILPMATIAGRMGFQPSWKFGCS